MYIERNMGFQKISLYFVICFNLMFLGAMGTSDPEEGGLDFETPRAAVVAESEKAENIDYNTFCKVKDTIPDDTLFGCELQAPNDGFEIRVCKLESGCGDLVNSSIRFHDAVNGKDDNLSVVKYSKVITENLKCKDETDPVKTTCMGYLEQWIPGGQAKLVQFNEHVFKNTEDAMISEIKAYQTTADAKTQTATDLQNIINWMTPPEGQCTMYQQLCDLEGFFKLSGGFVIHNPNVNEKMMLTSHCHSGVGDPTNERVLAVLNKFIKELKEAAEEPPSESD